MNSPCRWEGVAAVDPDPNAAASAAADAAEVHAESADAVPQWGKLSIKPET